MEKKGAEKNKSWLLTPDTSYLLIFLLPKELHDDFNVSVVDAFARGYGRQDEA